MFFIGFAVYTDSATETFTGLAGGTRYTAPTGAEFPGFAGLCATSTMAYVCFCVHTTSGTVSQSSRADVDTLCIGTALACFAGDATFSTVFDTGFQIDTLVATDRQASVAEKCANSLFTALVGRANIVTSTAMLVAFLQINAEFTAAGSVLDAVFGLTSAFATKLTFFAGVSTEIAVFRIGLKVYTLS